MEERVAAAATPDIVEAYQRDGAVCLRGLLNREELATLTRGIEANLASPSPRSIVASRPDDPGFFIEDFCNWQHNPDYRSIACSPYLAHVAGKLMKSRTVSLYHDHMLTKQPSTTTRTPWHQVWRWNVSRVRLPQIPIAGSALLQHRRLSERELLDTSRSRSARIIGVYPASSLCRRLGLDQLGLISAP